jgi:glyoxylase-like metal-dependent hydrolase (beta-lactamase superfamily II)
MSRDGGSVAVENIKHWYVGDVRITRIVELNGFALDAAMLLEGGTPELVASHSKWLRPHFATESRQIVMSWQAFVVETPTRKMMVDTCLGTDRKFHFDDLNGLQTSFLQDLASIGIQPEQIDTVLCTHLHFDHVGWNTRLEGGHFVPTFPRARYLFDKSEYANMQELARAGDWHAEHLPIAIQPVIDAHLVTFIDAAQYRVCDEVWFEPTPGHTPGHISVHVESRGEQAIITGDMMHHPIQCAVPRVPDNFDEDKPRASATRERFIKQYGDGRVLIIGSHFPHPTSGWIVPHEQGHRFEPDLRTLRKDTDG